MWDSRTPAAEDGLVDRPIKAGGVAAAVDVPAADRDEEIPTLERFRNSRALIRVVKGGIFLRKTPLGGGGSGVH